MTFLDTGYFIALLNPRDELHHRAFAWSQFVEDNLLVTEHVLWETVNHYSLPSNRSKVHALLAQVRSDPAYEIVPASPGLFDAGVLLHAQSVDKEWSLTDCISFVVMRERVVHRALAYDRHFEQAGFEALLRRDPSPRAGAKE